MLNHSTLIKAFIKNSYEKNKIGLSLLTLLSCLSLLSVTSCGGNDNTGSTAKPNQTQKADEKCTVNFDTNGGSSFNSQEVVKGSTIENLQLLPRLNIFLMVGI